MNKEKLEEFLKKHRIVIRPGIVGATVDHEDRGLLYHRSVTGTKESLVCVETLMYEGRTEWIRNQTGIIMNEDDVNMVVEALMGLRIDHERPYMPEAFNPPGFDLTTKFEGDIKKFKGTQILKKDGRVIYMSDTHGGAIRRDHYW